MKQFEIGRSAIQTSAVMLGSTFFGSEDGCDEQESHRVIAAALANGVSAIDTANTYADTRSEEIIGNYFAKHGPGQDILIATKFGFRPVDSPTNFGTSRRTIMNCVEASLRRLKRDRIDLLYCHTWYSPPRLEAMLYALDDLIAQGKVLAIACSNFPAWLLTRSLWLSDLRNLARFEAVQSVFSVLLQDIAQDLVPAARREEVSVIAYSPLASGALTGRHARDRIASDSNLAADKPISAFKRQLYFADARAAVIEGLTEVARKFSSSRDELVSMMVGLSLQWTLENVDALVIGARSAEQIEQSMLALDRTWDGAAKTEFAAIAEDWRRRCPVLYPPEPGQSIVKSRAPAIN